MAIQSASHLAYLKHSDNLVLEALMGATTENSLFPASNAKALPVSKAWRSSEGSLNAQKLRASFDVSREVDTVAIVGHNLTATATIEVHAGATPEAETFSETITWASGVAWKLLSATQDYRHWTIEITDEANANGYVAVGYLALGMKTQTDDQFQPRWTKTRIKRVRNSPNEFRAPIVGRKISEGTLLSVRWEGLSNTERDTLDAFLLSLDRVVDPMLLVPAPDETEAFFGRLAEDYLIAQDHSDSAEIAVDFISDSFGVVVAPAVPFLYEV